MPLARPDTKLKLNVVIEFLSWVRNHLLAKLAAVAACMLARRARNLYVYSSYVVFKGVLQRAVVLHTKHPAVVPGPYVTLKWRIS